MDSVYDSLSHLLLNDVEETGKELGRGAYGVVYEVKVSGLLCAGKKLHDIIAILEKESTSKKFVEECLLHSTLRHPNIVQLMGVYVPQEQQGLNLPILVMEYLPLSLAKCLETRFDLSLKMKYSILLDVGNGLNFLHNKKPPIVHRDISAYNILLTSTFDAKLSDLGVSRMIDKDCGIRERTLTMLPGNPAVMPPESLHSNPQYDTKLDVFSYGCLILHVFTHIWPAPKPQSGNLTEWERRSACTQYMDIDHPMFTIAKKCLDNDSLKRLDMKTIIQSLGDIIAKLPHESMVIDDMIYLYDDILNYSKTKNKELPVYDYPDISSLGFGSGKAAFKPQESDSFLTQSLPVKPPPLPERNLKPTKDTKISSPFLRRKDKETPVKKPAPLSRLSASVDNDLPPTFRPRYPGTPPINKKSFQFRLPSQSESVDVSSRFTDSFPPPLPPKPMTPILHHRKLPLRPVPPPPVPTRLTSLPNNRTSSVPIKPFTAQKSDWYYMSLSKESAEAILLKDRKMNGKFLIRIDVLGIRYLSVYYARTVTHIKIYKNEDDKFLLENGQNEIFDNFDQLVKYFQNNLLLLDGNGATFLVV